MRALTTAALTWSMIATVLAQTPPRDQGRFTAFGTASVSGVVVADDDTRAPLRRATVTLTRTGVDDTRVVATDDAGHFAFDRLPAASYTVSASKGAYITMNYGAPKPGMPGSSITLTDGQPFMTRPIALIRGAVIAGRLTGYTGQPIANLQVRADQFVMINGERRRRTTTGSTGTAIANAHGDYRISGLMPGDYLVSTSQPPVSVQGEVTAAELAWTAQPNGPAPVPARSFTPAPTMFPGTTDAGGGSVVTVGRGEERLNIDFAVQSVPVARVTGTVLGTDGRPAPNAMVLCSSKNLNSVLPPSGVPMSMTAADGVFACPQLAPGQYLLSARQVVDPAARAGLSPTPGMMPLWGTVELTVAGRDVSNVSIQVQTGLSLSGQAIFKPVAGAASPDPSLMQVRVVPAVPGTPVGSFSGTIRADGTFQIDGIVPGSYRLTSTLGPAAGSVVGWTMRSAMLGGSDVADVPVEIAQNTSGLVVTFSDAQTELSGALTDPAGQPAPQLYVLVFPSDKSLWSTGSRRVQSVRSTENGSYRIAGLPPGEYFLCALTELETTLQTEPSYLEQFVPSSIKITLGEGEKKTQSLRIGG